MEIQQFEYHEKYSHPIHLALNLTNDCNLACRYCFVEQKPNYMTLDIAIQAVEYLINNLKLHKTIFKDIENYKLGSIWFFGGEPLLCFNSIIKPLVKYCESKDYLKDLTFALTTNATLLDKEKIDFFKQYEIMPMVSIDGAPETQDYNRPYKNNSNILSSQLIEKNIPYLLQQFPEITFRSTIYQPTITAMFENYLYAESLGFKFINFTPDTRQINWVKEDYINIEKEFQKIFAYRLLQYRNNYFPISFTNINEIYSQILSHDLYLTNLELNNIENLEAQENIDYLKNCGLGTYMAAIDFKGDIYNCQERPSKGKKNIFLLGNLDNGIDFNKHKNFLKQYLDDIRITNGFQCHNNAELCQKCLLKNNCVKNCVSVSKDLYNNFNTMNENKCIIQNILLKLSLNLMDILVQENNQTFLLDLIKNIKNYNIFYSLIKNNNFC